MLKDLSNDTLLKQLKSLVGQEKEIIVRVIEYLKEVEVRKLYLKKSYASMFAFATEFLGYSEFEAHTRLQAARLTQAIPEVTEKIITGELNLSVAACAQSQFRREDKRREEDGEKPMRREEKREVLEMVSNCSRRQAEEKLNSHFGQQSELKEYAFLEARDFQSDLDKLMDEYSHLNFDRDLGKLIRHLVKKELAQIEKKRNGPQPRIAKVALSEAVPGEIISSKGVPSEYMRGKSVPARPIKKSRVYISIQVKRDVRKRSENKCTFVDPTTARRCNSTHALEFDHIVPVSKGGSNDPSNLTILCDAHNRWKGSDLSTALGSS